jgi:hypothetical protein
MIVIIGGMHRSGTSALAGVLHNNNIAMGEDKDFYPPPMRENPKGFFENIRFRRINDSMLAAADYKVKAWSPIIPTVSANIEQRTRMRDLINHYCGTYSDWGWKDPRTSLCMHQWLAILAEMRLIKEVFIINCLRHPMDVANSMRVRGNKEKYEGQFEKVTEAYQATMRKQLQVWTEATAGYAEVFFNGLICDPDKTLSDLSFKLRREVLNNGFIEYNIARNVDRRTICAREEVSASL